MKLAPALALVLAATACAPQADDPRNLSAESRAALTGSPRSPRPSFDADRIAAMKDELLATDAIVDLLHQESALGVDWQVGVVGPRQDGLDIARDTCRRLRGAGLVDEDTDVRVVDIVQSERNGGDFRAASQGHVECARGESLGV